MVLPAVLARESLGTPHQVDRGTLSYQLLSGPMKAYSLAHHGSLHVSLSGKYRECIEVALSAPLICQAFDDSARWLNCRQVRRVLS